MSESMNVKPLLSRFWLRSIRCLFLLVCCRSLSQAAIFSFSDELVRAEFVFIGHIVSHADGTVTFKPAEVLRGAQTADLTLSERTLEDLDGYGVDYLLVSQGDDRYGKPLPVPDFLRGLKGQGVWRGWLAYPIVKVGERQFVRCGMAFLDGKPLQEYVQGVRFPGLYMEQVKLLLQRIPYNPHVNEKR